MNRIEYLHLASREEFEFSIVEAVYGGDLTRQILEFVEEKIKPEDVAEQAGGKELKPHITILYGIKERKPPIPKLQQVIQNHPALNSVKWLGLSKFEAQDHDVLIIQVESEEAQQLFKDMNNIFPDNVNSWPDFKPHTTLAYMKKGKADKYIQEFGEAFVDETVPIKWIRFAFNDQITDFWPSSGELRDKR